VVSDIYQTWRDRLAGMGVPIHDGQPEPGRYKMRMKSHGEWLPVAIGPDADGNLVAIVDGKPSDPIKIWVWCSKHPVTQDAYKFRVANGHWPDEPKPVVRQNMPADPFEALRVEMLDKVQQANHLLKVDIDTQEKCDLARNMQAQLLDIIKRASAMHKTEKAPVLAKEREIDGRYGFRDTVSDIAVQLRAKFESWMRAEERRKQDEAKRKFEAECAAAEAERARIEAERARKLADEPVLALTDPEPELPELPVAPEPVKVNAGGGFGRRAGLKSVWVPVMTNYAAALAHFSENAKIRELVQKLAEQAVRAGARELPGFDVREDRRAA
jgi:hypothetical protein